MHYTEKKKSAWRQNNEFDTGNKGTGIAEALQLYGEPLEELCLAADEIRYQFCGNRFDLCTIINGKSGRCSENCKYCAQSACYHTEIEEYPLLAVEKIKEQAKYNEERGVLRYSIVTSGKALNDTEVEHVCESVREIHKESKIKVCVSGGLLNETQFRKLKQAGVTRVHNNLETSRQNFPNVCTTHTYEDSDPRSLESRNRSMQRRDYGTGRDRGGPDRSCIGSPKIRSQIHACKFTESNSGDTL